MDRIRAANHVIRAIEKILFITLVMDGLEFRRIEEPAGVQAVDGEEISPFFAAERDSKSAAHGAKASIRSRETPSRLRHSQPGSRRHLDHQAGLVAILRRRTARDGFQRLNRIQRDLVGKHLALLVRDGLAVHGKGIFRVVPKPMEQSVRIRHHAG